MTKVFLKALKAKDIDAVMKMVDVPFLMGRGLEKNEGPIEKLEGLKAKFKELVDLIEPEEVADTIGEIFRIADFRKEVEGDERSKKRLALLEKHLGPNGVIVSVLKDKEERGSVLVRIKDGEIKVVGLSK